MAVYVDDAAMRGGEGQVYLAHFARKIGNPDNPKGQAQHYLGHTRRELCERQAEELGPNAPAILRAVNEAGIEWHVVRTWPGTKDTERQLKLMNAANRLCPECTEHPLSGAGAVARAAALRRHREAQAARRQRQAERLEAVRAEAARRREATAAARRADPYEDGRQMARQWLARQDEAGRTADEIEAAHDYVTAPWAEMAHRTTAETERYRGYTDLVRAALAEFRGQDAEATAGASGGLGRAASSEMEEEMDGEAWLARDGDGRVLEVDAGGYPGREAGPPDDGRPIAEAEEPAGWRDEAESAAWGGRGPSRSYAEWVADGSRDNLVRDMEPEAG
jgi:hypothetical protein